MIKIFFNQKIEPGIEKLELLPYDNYLQENIHQNNSTVIKKYSIIVEVN